jgi:hypothetical protein
MKLVVVTQWVRTERSKSHLTKASLARIIHESETRSWDSLRNVL